jgi:hypothetical protein
MKSIQRKAVSLAVFAMMAISFVHAQTEDSAPEPEKIGLTTTLKVAFGDVMDKTVIAFTPWAAYFHSFDAVDVYGEIDYTATMDDPLRHVLFLRGEIGYNLGLTPTGTLSLILNNEDSIAVKPEPGPGYTHWGQLEPSLKWTQKLPIGTLWVNPGLSYVYLTGFEGQTSLKQWTVLGWTSTFGLNADYTLETTLDPAYSIDMHTLSLWYALGRSILRFAVEANGDFNEFGLNPEIDINIGGPFIYARADITTYSDSNKNAKVEPSCGIWYYF